MTKSASHSPGPPPFGRIASSYSHATYACQVFGPNETETTPDPAHYGLASFVGIPRGSEALTVALVYDTILMNPDFGQLGPRLSSESELAVFSPDYLSERATIVSLLILGEMAPSRATQRVPRVAISLDARVRSLTDDEIARFHYPDRDFCIGYLSAIPTLPQGRGGLVMEHLLEDLLQRFGDHAREITVVSQSLTWAARIQSIG